MSDKIKLFSEIPLLSDDRLTLRGLQRGDEAGLKKLVGSPRVYRFLPTFLFEKKYSDLTTVIDRLYTECIRGSMILGIFDRTGFCGLAELYGLRDDIHKISVGYRLREECWGRGIATEALGLMIDYLYGSTDIEIVTASTMVENRASANVLTKNGFSLVNTNVDEDWGYPAPTKADKWIR